MPTVGRTPELPSAQAADVQRVHAADRRNRCRADRKDRRKDFRRPEDWLCVE
jgi:hypothetical protein